MNTHKIQEMESRVLQFGHLDEDSSKCTSTTRSSHLILVLKVEYYNGKMDLVQLFKCFQAKSLLIGCYSTTMRVAWLCVGGIFDKRERKRARLLCIVLCNITVHKLLRCKLSEWSKRTNLNTIIWCSSHYIHKFNNYNACHKLNHVLFSLSLFILTISWKCKMTWIFGTELVSMLIRS